MGPFPHLPKILKKQCAMIIGQFEKKVLHENYDSRIIKSLFEDKKGQSLD